MEARERRGDERRPVGDNWARLLWADGPAVRETSALLKDISRGGASFVAELPPPVGSDVCFRLEEPRRSGWVTVRVVRSGEGMAGGLSFAGHFAHHLIPNLI